MKPFLSIVMPVCDEGKELPLALVDIDRELKTADYSYEVIVADDRPSDARGKMMDRFGKFFPSLRTVKGTDGKGKGHAVRLGMLSAKGNYRLFIDVGSHVPVGRFNEMIPLFKGGADMVVVDTDRFQCFSEAAAEKIFRAVLCEGEGIGFETIAVAKLMGLGVREISLRPDDFAKARPKLSASLSKLKDAIIVKLNVLFHRYAW